MPSEVALAVSGDQLRAVFGPLRQPRDPGRPVTQLVRGGHDLVDQARSHLVPGQGRDRHRRPIEAVGVEGDRRVEPRETTPGGLLAAGWEDQDKLPVARVTESKSQPEVEISLGLAWASDHDEPVRVVEPAELAGQLHRRRQRNGIISN